MTELDIKRRASELLQKGRYDEAIAQYEALLEGSKKSNPAIHNLIGDIYVKQGNFERGFEHYLSAAKAYKEEGLFHNGIAVGKKILRLDRDQTEVYGMLADLYARQGLGMDSLKFLREFARRKEEVDEYPIALAAYAESCDILADVPDVHIAYGEMLERVDRLEDAVKCYTNAAQAYTDKGWHDQAEQLTRRAKTLGVGGGGSMESSASVSDLMNLRTLDDDNVSDLKESGVSVADLMSLRSLEDPPAAPAPAPPAVTGRSDEPAGLELDLAPAAPSQDPPADDAEPWSEYQPEGGAALPPPPPLPPPGGPPAPAAAPMANPNDLFVEPPGLDGTETETPQLNLDASGVGSLQDALDEMASLDAAASAPPASAPPPPAPAAPAAPPPPAAEAPAGPSKEPGEHDLSDLPGIILPGQTPPRPPVAAPDPPAAAEPPAQAATPPAPGVDGDGDLHSFFEESATDSSEHTVVIGDDFELLREGGDVNQVIADFRDATMEVLDLEDHQAHYDLGTTYMEMELFDEAAAEFELSARGQDHALPSQEMLGYCFLRKGQIDVAVKELEKGLAIEGHDDRTKLGLLYNLGIACGVLDHEQQAIAYFEKILQIDPEFRDTHSRLDRLVKNSA